MGPDFLFLPSDPATRAGNMEGPAGKCSRGAAGSGSSSQVQQCRTPWPVQDRDGKQFKIAGKLSKGRCLIGSDLLRLKIRKD
jgi:hypothetical protein